MAESLTRTVEQAMLDFSLPRIGEKLSRGRFGVACATPRHHPASCRTSRRAL
jgi:hypothetical protein